MLKIKVGFGHVKVIATVLMWASLLGSIIWRQASTTTINKYDVKKNKEAIAELEKTSNDQKDIFHKHQIDYAGFQSAVLTRLESIDNTLKEIAKNR